MIEKGHFTTLIETDAPSVKFRFVLNFDLFNKPFDFKEKINWHDI